jgi:hypothetical protein
MNKQLEYLMQTQICEYLEKKHPKVLFISDASSGAKLTQMQAVRNRKIQKTDFKIPDLQILQPTNEYKGLFLELKKECPYKKVGGLKVQLVTIYKTIGKKRVSVGSYNHLELQDNSLKKLREKGYLATFCWSYDQAVEIIESYLKDI